MIGGCGSKGMGTKVQIENYPVGHCSMRDLSRESNGASWPSCFRDHKLPSEQFYYDGFVPGAVADSHSGYDKELVKQTMLEHEAIFKNQVYELHRLYQVQRDLMDEVRRKEQYEQHIPYETSSSSSPVPSLMRYEDVQRWNGSKLPVANSVCGRPTSGPETVQSSPQSVKGKSIQASPASFQNGCSPKNSDVSDSRPTKLRRRMLDLQLPADEYIDTDEIEQFGVAKVSHNGGLSPDKNGKAAPENAKLFPNRALKAECSSRVDSHVNKSKALADLNEPLLVEEATVDSSANSLSRTGCCNDVKHWDLSTKSLSSWKDFPQNSLHGSVSGASKNYHLENRLSNQNLFGYALESEQETGSFRFITQAIHSEKGPRTFHSVNAMLEPTSEPPAFSIGDHFKGDPSKAKSGGNTEKCARNFYLSSYNIPEPTMTSHRLNQPSSFDPADLGKPWDQGASSWGKTSSGLTQKSTSIQTGPFLTSGNLNKSPLLSSTQSNGLFGNKWNLICSTGGNATFEGEPYQKNGFYLGASNASFKEQSARIPPVGLDSGKSFFRATASIDVKLMKDVNLNVALPNDALHNHKSEDLLTVLPWLRGKNAHGNKAETSNNDPSSLPGHVLQGSFLPSSSCEVNVNADKKPDSSDFPSSRKILGVPIFESLAMPKKENSTLIFPSASENRSAKEETGPSRRKLDFDMNAPCQLSDSELGKTCVEEEAEVFEKKMQTESTSLRNHFDLNSCITEEEIPCMTSLPDNRKGDTGIDLEAPIILEDDEAFLPAEYSLTKEPKKLPELPPCRAANGGEEAELAKLAAEAIIALSSIQPEVEVIQVPEEADAEGPLHWFADMACSSGRDNNNGEDTGDCLPKELDDFESMTLRLKECTSEEYFPKPSIPEIPNLEESSPRVLTTRTRKGQARRGRQRRDFQRDILPGLASLSRHEVTEDMQTFGGLMRATGYSWQCGPNRRNATRNGCGRGRRRAVAAAPPAPVHAVSATMKQHLLINSNNTDVGLEDRSLTGWGKTTRRPRRQRLPVGNLTPPVPLS